MSESDTEHPQPTQSEDAGIDLSPLLKAWEYDEARSVRRLRADDGREVIQVRLPLGIEQYELSGRPDGKRPRQTESWLHFYLRKAREHRRKSPRREIREDEGPRSESWSPPPRREEFTLSDEDFSRLHQEGLLYYYRYLLFFQMQEYALCTRDTGRNLRLLDFVASHARPEASQQLEQYRPYILRMHIMSRALEKIQRYGDARQALRLLREGRKRVDALEPIPGNQVFDWEKTRALVSLDDLVSQIESQIPLPRRERLQRELEAAIREENYEKAASLRDQLNRLQRRNRS